MNETIKRAIDEQINNEFFAAYQYLAMSAYFEAENLPGFAGWMREQAKEEVEHAMKFFDFSTDRGDTPALQSVGAPGASDFSSPQAVFECAYEHERKVTSQIYKLYELSMAEKDYPAQILLQWFIAEQLEEEKTTSTIVERLKLSDGSTSALLMLDNELGSRRGAEATTV